MKAKPPVPEQAEILKIVDLVRLNIGNHELYVLYRADGGTASWKSFRRGVALYRGGLDEKTEVARILDEQDRQAHLEKQHAERELEREQKKEREMERKKRKEEEMARREELNRGQRVWVRVRYADQIKLRSAVVCAVMRGAVNVQIDDEPEPRTVRFNEVETSVTPAQQAQQMSQAQSQIEVEYRRGRHVAPEPKPVTPLTAVPPAFAALGRPQQSDPLPPAAYPAVGYGPDPNITVSGTAGGPGVRIPTAQPDDTLSKVSAWIEQGTAMRENLVKQQVLLQTEMDDLALEALRIEEAIASKRAELVRLTTLLAALDQMRAVAA
jgi:hypothetical protein